MFTDRKDAGQKLAAALSTYQNKSVLVLAIPRGGVEVGCYVAENLKCEISCVITRKLGYPSNPEAAFGALAEDGSVYLSEDASRLLTQDQIQEVIEHEKLEIERRIKKFRRGKPLPDIKNKTVILVDDGIATGATLFASINLCKKSGASKIIVAAPVASEEMETLLEKMVDEVIILEKPPYFYAVGQVYYDFENLTDEETQHLIDRANNFNLQRQA